MLECRLSPCRLCPRECGADRRGGERGWCGAGLLPKVAAVAIHHGEEPPISGSRGAGNVFFGGCNLHCRFCQNFPISRLGAGRETTVEELAGSFLGLQRRGAHNVNLVTPTHVASQAAAAVVMAREQGLRLPVVWNSNGYESVEVLRLLEGVVDVWLPDMKYGDDEQAMELSEAPGYVAVNRAAVAEMLRQKGPLVTDAYGVAVSGVVIRHLVLPGRFAGTAEVLRYIAETWGPATPVSLMCQYFPAHRAHGHPLLGRRLLEKEWEEALAELEESGLEAGWVQEYHGNPGT